MTFHDDNIFLIGYPIIFLRGRHYLKTVLHVILTIAEGLPGVGTGGEVETEESKEEQEEHERLRQETIKQAEIERRIRYKKQEEDRESMRQIIRDKADTLE